MKKRLISLFLIVCVLAASFAVPAGAASQTLYRWTRYNVTAFTSYQYGYYWTAEIVTNVGPDGYAARTGMSQFSFDSSSGQFSVSGSLMSIPFGTNTNDYYYLASPTMLCAVRGLMLYDAGGSYYNIVTKNTVLTQTPVTTNVCGSTSYGSVYSTSSSAYPSNGESNGYWYVYQGTSANSLSITANPTDQTVSQNAVASLSVTASGSGTLSYQWYRNGSAISGAVSGTYSPDTSSIGSDSYYCVVTSTLGGYTVSETSASSAVTVTNPLSITSHPVSAAVNAGETVSFTVTANGAESFQWYRNGSVIAGADSASYSFTTESSDSGSSFYCRVSNGNTSIDSDAAVLTVNDVFSVSIPVTLSLAASENGAVTGVSGAGIVNNSTKAVKVSGITVSAENGWTLVPYGTNMADAKVDSKKIGFRMNSAETTSEGSAENLTLSGDWSIAPDAELPLDYGAVVSAASEAVNEQVLTVTFIMKWAE